MTTQLNKSSIDGMTVKECIDAIAYLRTRINDQVFGVYAIGGEAEVSNKAAVVSFDLDAESVRILVIDRSTGLRVHMLDELTAMELADYSALMLMYEHWDGGEPLHIPYHKLTDVSVGFDSISDDCDTEDCDRESSDDDCE